MASSNDTILDVIGMFDNESTTINVKITNGPIATSVVQKNASPTLSPVSEEFKNVRDALWVAYAKNNPLPKIDPPIEPYIVVGDSAVYYPRHRF